ncbi:DinB family protein [Pontibacter arcticus]|uniref:DinB family protein n=1 Tax=Pontibacter arcticus TaxID=2080288 RepID=A0A364RGM2_9BACT|nr:DinB family protein [Pontibacter arcticus]RAU83459.1 DinB family protein [Pontibacter arcticus]
MNPRLEAKYLQLEKSRNRLLDKLEVYDEAILTAQPTEGKWSVMEIIAHLIQVDELTLSYIQHKVKKENELKAASFSSELYTILLKLALKSGMKFKAPSSIATLASYGEDLQTLRQKWNEVRYQLEDMLTDLPAQVLDKAIFRHPRVGMLTINQTLTFLQDHFDHHMPQVNALIPKNG